MADGTGPQTPRQSFVISYNTQFTITLTILINNTTTCCFLNHCFFKQQSRPELCASKINYRAPRPFEINLLEGN